jgi:hypothetical protein
MASLSPGIGSLAQGYGLSGAGRYSARLDAFTKNAKDIEAYDFGTAVESEEAKKQKDAATFIEVASGFKAVPNTLSMYNKHHALLSKKYEVLFSDENMTAMAATPEGRAKFSQAVEQLNQEAKAYETIYSSTFGDPTKATGAGITYSDQLAREQRGGGSAAYFQAQGFRIDKTDEIFRNQLVDLDNSADIEAATITFDPSTGTWGGVPDSDLLTTDLQVASQWFSYKADQAVFTPPTSFVSTGGLYEVMSKFSSEDAMLADAKTRASQRPLDAIAYWQQTKGTDEDKGKSVQQLYQEMVSGKTIQVATDAYANAMVEEVKARKEREEDEKKDKKKQGKKDDDGRTYIRYIVVGDDTNRSIPLTTSNLGTMQQGSFQYAKLVNNELFVVLKKDGVETEFPARDYENILNKKFGPSAIDRMKISLGATTTTTSQTTTVEGGKYRTGKS